MSARRFELGGEPTALAALDKLGAALWAAKLALDEIRKEAARGEGLSNRVENALDEIEEKLGEISTDARPDHSSWLLCELCSALVDNDSDIGMAKGQAEMDARDDAKDRHDADAFDRANDR